MDGGPDRDRLIALLDFYVAAGIDIALDETPHDRFAEARAPAGREPERPAAPSRAPALPLAATPLADPVAADVRAQAAQARSLDELRALLEAFDGCPLKASARQLVFADGTPGSRVMLLGEAPGAEEDRSGRPFVGRAGQLLDRMLAAIGLDRGSVYIANVVPWRPPGNRTPTPQEVAVCKPFIRRQIELVAPEVLVCLGGPATQTLLGTRDGILKARGRWSTYPLREREIRALATLHPAYLLRQPLQKRLAWRDFRALRRALDEEGSEPARPVTL